MIHLGYIIQTAKGPSITVYGQNIGEQPRICVLVDSSSMAHYFYSEDEKFQPGLWVTYEGEGYEIYDVIPHTEYKANKSVIRYAIPHMGWTETKNRPMQLCCSGDVVDKNGKIMTLSENETYIIKKLYKNEPVNILPLPSNNIDDFEKMITDISEKVKYVSTHLKEISDSYIIEYKDWVKTKIGDDDELTVTRLGKISYTDSYISMYMPTASKVVLDEGRYGNLRHEFTKERAKKDMQEAKDNFLVSYDKFKHFCKLIYDYQVNKQNEVRDIINNNNELLLHWNLNIKVLSENFGCLYEGIKSLLKEIEDYNHRMSQKI